ncbi:hypothetical protein [Streptomyces fragilis]|uniref:Integral membrane protein n=1 Tax=Streptomyces fragilis TaxID=67301 RepID=A0ABV2YCJ1_9ACTN|nr:hypothetical protein [Streptomyces fragilis]
MHALTSLAGRPISSHEWAVVLLLFGGFAGLTGLLLVLRPAVPADWSVQQQQDRYDAYGRGRPPAAADRHAQQVLARAMGGFFAILGPVLMIAGVVQLVSQ